MTNEWWLKWTVARHHRSHDYKVSMKPVRTGNAMVDGIALGTDGDRIAIEVKPPSDDIIRGIRPCYEAICAGYAHGCGLDVGNSLRTNPVFI